MTMNENPRYAIKKIHEGIGKATGKEALGLHKSFMIQGKPIFETLNLKEYNWKNIHGLTSKQRNDFLSSDPDYRYSNAEETRVYKGPQGIAIAYLNHNTGIHQFDININNQKDNADSMKAVKSMFEMELGIQMYDTENLPEGLVKKLKSK